MKKKTGKKAAKKTATKQTRPPTKPLPPDPEGRNDDRAAWANTAVEAFAAEVFHLFADREDCDMVLGDLLCDLRHWCDRMGLDFYKILTRSDHHYAEEIGCDYLPRVLSPIARDALDFYERFQEYINHEDYELPDCSGLRDGLIKLGLDDAVEAAEAVEEDDDE